MATSRAFEELTDMVTCTICYEAFEGRDPRSLPCLHVFCSKCIQDCLDAKQQQIGSIVTTLACPICQTTATIPRRSAANLPAFFPGVKIQSVIEQLKENHSICKVCESTTHKAEVVSYCFQCTTAMCSSCREKHDRKHGDHTVTMVTSSTISNFVCSEHDKYVAAYCIDCRQPVCSRCQIGSHCDHIINYFTCDIDERLASLDSSLSSCTESAGLVLAKLLTIQREFGNHMSRALVELDQHHADTITQLTQQYETFRTQLQHRLDQENQELDKFLGDIRESYDLVVKLRIQMDSLTLPLSEVPDVSIACTDDAVTAIKQHIPTIDVTFQPRRLVFVPGSGTVSLGRIAEEVDDVEIEKPLGTCHLTSYQRDDSRSPSTSVLEPKLLWSVDCDTILGVEFFPGGGLITSVGTLGIHLYDHASGQNIGDTSSLCVGFTRDISLNAAKSNVAILKYTTPSQTGNLLIINMNSGTRQEHPVCKGAWSLACTQSGDYIVGSVHHLLFKYSSECHQIWEKKLSECPHHIIVDHHDRILACLGNQIVIFDQDGEKLLAFPTSKDRRKLDPYGICVDSKDNILVSDMMCRSVLLYNTNGNFIKNILQTNGDPGRVGLNRDTLMVLEIWNNTDGRKLCMYEV